MKTTAPRLIVASLLFATCLTARPQPAAAQRGQILGEILKGVGQIAAEGARQKALADQQRRQEQQQRQRQQQAQRLPVNLPPGVLARPPLGGDPQTGSINVGSQEAAQFVGDLVSFRQTLDGLIDNLQRRGAPRPVRAAVPELVQLSGQVEALIASSPGLVSPAQLAQQYQPIDASFRTVAYRLQPFAQNDPGWSASLNQLQQLADRLAAATQVTPGFDYPQLRRLMHSASAHLLDLLDDLQLARRTSVSGRVEHQIRVLQQRLTVGADQLETLPPQEIVNRYNDYISQWSQLASELQSMRDPHIDQRVERIRQVGLETHRVLRVDPPRSFVNLPSVAQSLYRDADRLADRLTLGGLQQLPINDQLQALRLARDFESDCRGLSQIRGDDYRGSLGAAAQHWGALRPLVQRLPSIDQQLLGSIDSHLGELGGPSFNLPGVGYGGGPGIGFDPRSFVSLAAAVEGGTLSLRRDIDRIDGRIRSSTYRRQITEASRESYRHAERLHDELTESRPENDDIDREVRQLAEHWQVLGGLINELPRQAGNDPSIQQIVGQYRQLAPNVAQLISALLE